MNNFAQEFPILIYLPFIILTAVATAASVTQLAIGLTAKPKPQGSAPAQLTPDIIGFAGWPDLDELFDLPAVVAAANAPPAARMATAEG